MKKEITVQIRSLTEKIATELVFAEPDKDLGLLPVNSLLGQIEEMIAAAAATEAVLRGAQQARKWVDAAFESTGTFSAPTLKLLGEWVVWWQEVLSADERQSSPPPLPAQWDNPGGVASAPLAASTPSPSIAGVADSSEEPVVSLNLEEDRELLKEFINESDEHLQNIEQGVLVLEENPADAETLNSIFRAFHTFKGGSGFLNLPAIQSLAHELESLLDLARQQKLTLTPGIINLILEGGDTLKRFVDEIAKRLAVKGSARPIIVPTLKLLARIRAAVAGGVTEEAPAKLEAPRTEAVQNSPVVTELPQAESAAKPASAPPAPAAESAPVLKEPPRTEAAGKSPGGPSGSTVKVDTLKLDILIDLVGEMVIAQSLVVQNPELSQLDSEQLTRDLAQLGRITKDLQRTAMSLRMVPIGATFQKMGRLVRDSAAKVGKQVELATDGEDTELDRTIVEEISDPLIHMIRNSVDHGIEKPEIRLQRGKPAHGTIWLKAYHRGGNIVIEIKDDGGGLDRERILAKGIEKGLVKAGEQLTDSQIFSLILEAGFSTAEKVTSLSGRGVGMDVVRRNIEKLRGKLDIQSQAGLGTTFSIHLPLTLAIIDGLLVGVGDQRYILPTLLVRETFRPTKQMMSTVRGSGEMINVRGRLHPMLRLYAHLGVEPASTDPMQSIVLLVESGDKVRCVLVDRLLGKQEVVIKSLGETFRKNRHVAGAAILGDGGVGLILDPQSLVHLQNSTVEAAA